MQKGFWGNITKPIIGLSPMDGITDAAFRFITAKYSNPSIIITEFTSVEALQHGAIRALKAFWYDEIERPIVAQIYGTNLEGFYQATIIACAMGFDGIDINMGCPSKSVSSNGAGAGLIQNPKLAKEIIRICQQASLDWYNDIQIEKIKLHPEILKSISIWKNGKYLNSERHHLPISVKTRIGYNQIITEEWIKNLIEAKPVNISIHGRILKQMYTGNTNWEEIGKAAKLAKSAGISILGNGDIQNLNEAHEKIKQYGVDGVLIGRATFGNPWIFQNTNISSNIEKSIQEKLAMAIEHGLIYEKYFGTHWFAPMKKHLGWYCSNFPYAKELRLKLMLANSCKELEQILISEKINPSTPVSV